MAKARFLWVVVICCCLLAVPYCRAESDTTKHNNDHEVGDAEHHHNNNKQQEEPYYEEQQYYENNHEVNEPHREQGHDQEHHHRDPAHDHQDHHQEAYDNKNNHEEVYDHHYEQHHEQEQQYDHVEVPDQEEQNNAPQNDNQEVQEHAPQHHANEEVHEPQQQNHEQEYEYTETSDQEEEHYDQNYDHSVDQNEQDGNQRYANQEAQDQNGDNREQQYDNEQESDKFEQHQHVEEETHEQRQEEQYENNSESNADGDEYEYVDPTGVDVDWPMHYPSSRHPDAQGRRNTAERYRKFLYGCSFMDSNGGSEEDCNRIDQERMTINRKQPPTLRNYTATGFEKVGQAPAGVVSSLKHFYDKYHTSHMVREAWPPGSIHANHWASVTKTLPIEGFPHTEGAKSDAAGDNSGQPSLSAQKRRELIALVQPIVEKWCKTPLVPTAIQGIREYRRGAVVVPSVNRLPFVITAVINVAQSVVDDWPLQVISHDGKAVNVTMLPGDMVSRNISFCVLV